MGIGQSGCNGEGLGTDRIEGLRDGGRDGGALGAGSAAAGQERKRRRRFGVSIAVALAILAILLLRFMGCSRMRDVAPGVDKAAHALADGEPKMEAKDGGGAVNITYALDARIDIGAHTASVHLENPARSTHGMVAELLVESGGESVVVAKSGLVPAGFEIDELELVNNVVLHSGTYSGAFSISFYDPAGGERAYVSASIPLPSIQAVE